MKGAIIIFSSHTTAIKQDIALKTEALRQNLQKLPKGELKCFKNGKYTKWFLYNNQIGKYLKKTNRDKAEQLALKKYFKSQLNDLLLLDEALDNFINCQNQLNKNNDSFFKSPAYSELLCSNLKSHDSTIKDWLNQNDVYNSYKPMGKRYITNSGEYVRSKSEVIISNCLFSNRIPYKYEAGFLINNERYLYPDFTIMHPKTFKIFYWEHFGLMDSESYRESAFNKLKIYGNHSVIPFDNLILTFENNTCPLDISNIEYLIHKFFS